MWSEWGSRSRRAKTRPSWKYTQSLIFLSLSVDVVVVVHRPARRHWWSAGDLAPVWWASHTGQRARIIFCSSPVLLCPGNIILEASRCCVIMWLFIPWTCGIASQPASRCCLWSRQKKQQKKECVNYVCLRLTTMIVVKEWPAEYIKSFIFIRKPPGALFLHF